VSNTDDIDCSTDDFTPDAKNASGKLVVCVTVCVSRGGRKRSRELTRATKI